MSWLLLAVLGLGVLAAIAVLADLYLRRHATDDLIDGLIQPLDQRFTGSDEALQARTAKRRKAADEIRARAARVETGVPVAKVLEMQKRA